MSEPQKNSDVIDLSSETVVIALELLDAELRKSPERLAKALQSAEVQKAINKALEDFARERLRKTPTTVSEADAKALGEKLVEVGKEAVAENVKSQIKSTAKYKELDKSIKALSEAFKKTPMGVWLDEHKALVYIVGAGAVVGGAAAMYITRTGDPVTETVLPLLGSQSVSFKVLGGLKLEAGVDKVVFRPSQRFIETKTFLSGKWKRIQVRLNLAVTAADGKFTAATDGKIVIPLPKGVTVQAGGGYNSANQNWSLNLSVGVDLKGLLHVGVLAGVGKGGLGPVPSSPAFRALPEPPKNDSRAGGYIGLGISGSF